MTLAHRRRFDDHPILSGCLSMGVAMGATAATFRWGVDPIATSVGGISLFLALVNFAPLGRTTATAIALGFTAGMTLPIMGTIPITKPFIAEDPSSVPYDASGDLDHNIHVSTLRECVRDKVEAWASLSYTANDNPGTDAISWLGVPPDIKVTPFQPELFGMAPMDDPDQGTTRQPIASLCTKSDGIVTLGSDNSPDGKYRGKVWYHDGTSYSEKAVDGRKYVTNATQNPTTLEVQAILRRSADNTYWCGSFSQPSLEDLQRDSPDTEWLPIPPDVHLLDSVYQNGRVYLLFADVDERGEVGSLQISKAPCDGRPIELDRLKGSDGDPIGEVNPEGETISTKVGTPSISIGPNGEVVMFTINDLRFRVFEGSDEVSAGRLIHPGYTPSSSGVHALTEPQSGGRAWLMYYATPKEGTDSIGEANYIVPVEYSEIGRCIRNTGICLKRR